MIGFGLMLPVLPFYIEQMALTENGSSQAASFHFGALTGIFALMQFFFAPVWGKLSDRIGRRRPFLIFGLAGNIIALIFFGSGTNLLMLYIARILNGVFSAAVLPIASAYVADVTDESMRGRGIAWLGTAVGLGVVAGPALGGFLSRLNWQASFSFGPATISNFSLPFLAAAALSAITLFVVLKWLPESQLAPCFADPAQKKTMVSGSPAASVSAVLKSSLVKAFVL